MQCSDAPLHCVHHIAMCKAQHYESAPLQHYAIHALPHRHMCAIFATQLYRYAWVLYVLRSYIGVYGVTQKGAQSVPDTDSGHTSDYKADIVLVEHQY